MQKFIKSNDLDILSAGCPVNQCASSASSQVSLGGEQIIELVGIMIEDLPSGVFATEFKNVRAGWSANALTAVWLRATVLLFEKQKQSFSCSA